MLKDLPRYECLLEVAKQFPQLDPQACEAYLHVLRTGDELARHSAYFFNAHGLSTGRFLVLMLLLDCVSQAASPRTPAELAEMANCTRATMTGLIDTLEKDAMVCRVPDEMDRRMMRVEITAKGRAHLVSMLPEHFRRITFLMSGLEPEEARQLVSLLQKIISKTAAKEPLETAENLSSS